MLKRSVLVAGLAAGSVLWHPDARVSALEDCPAAANCAQITVGSETIPVNSGGSIDVAFQQGDDDGQPQQGIDDIAAIAFSIGLPGDGAGNPLVFDCEGGQLAAGAVAVDGAISDDFAVIVENESCNARDRCLCPGDGQERDDFVNIVIYGPRELPIGGPVEIPRLPDSGTLVTLNLQAGPDAQEGSTVDLHVYCEQDDGIPPRPPFTADLSIGDQSAVDQTADRPADESRINCASGQVTFGPPVTPMPSDCVGDCDGNGAVAINELITGVNIALGNLDASACPAMDPNGNGEVAINELIQAVNNALNGCPS